MRKTIRPADLACLIALSFCSIAAPAAGQAVLTEAEVKERLAHLFLVKDPALWRCDDQADTLVFEKRLEVREVGGVVEALNRRFNAEKLPEVRVLRTERDTVVVTVSDPEQLTQRMGTTGATCYLAEVAFSLTSIEEVDYIWLEVPEGDHAGPGRYGRASFVSLLPLGKSPKK